MKNISSFPDYIIINESRAQIIDPKGVSFNPYTDSIKHPMEIIKKYAPWYDPTKAKTPLYRNVNRENYDEYLLMEPKNRKYIKNTANSTRNYVNMIIDEEWTGFPDRSNSIIGSTGHWSSKVSFGEFVYRVIPLKVNSKLGISPTSDLWFGFDLRELSDKLNIQPNNSLMTKDIDKLLAVNLKLKRFYGSKKEFILDLNTDNRLKQIPKDLNMLDELRNLENEYGSLYNCLKHYISPENGKNKSKFEIIKYGNSTILEDGRKEFWTNAPCLMIKNDWLERGDLDDVIKSYLNNRGY